LHGAGYSAIKVIPTPINVEDESDKSYRDFLRYTYNTDNKEEKLVLTVLGKSWYIG